MNVAEISVTKQNKELPWISNHLSCFQDKKQSHFLPLSDETKIDLKKADRGHPGMQIQNINAPVSSMVSSTVSSTSDLEILKQQISAAYLTSEPDLVRDLAQFADLTPAQSQNIGQKTAQMIRDIRDKSDMLGYVDQLMLEYSLSSEEGIILMRIAEALLRTPDQHTSALFVRDRLLAGDWRAHRGQGRTGKVNLTTEALNFADRWIETTGGSAGKSLIAKLGDQVLLKALQQAMQIMGNHFVLGHSIEAALSVSSGQKSRNLIGYSYDMLGEAAITEADANRYHQAYLQAANALASQMDQNTDNWQAKDGLSVKLSALHPRYDLLQAESCVPVLTSRVKDLALIAQKSGFGLTIDAEEVERLEISFAVIEALLQDPDLQDWQGLSIVVQAYQRRAMAVLRYLIQLAKKHHRQLAVRLVKGAYWDREIKRAQELGLSSYPVFTRKEHTDLSYLACAKLLLSAPDQIYPQFATHNVQTALTILALATPEAEFEFQRLHGMGAELHHHLQNEYGKRSRVYAPVGKHADLLPYLVRRLLENGANSSFVNQLYDPSVSPADFTILPNDKAAPAGYAQAERLTDPTDQFQGARQSAKGIDIQQQAQMSEIDSWLAAEYRQTVPHAALSAQAVVNPARSQDVIGHITDTNLAEVKRLYQEMSGQGWLDLAAPDRGAILMRAADLLEQEMSDFLPILVREAGKIWLDAVAEIREAVDFCRYYALQCQDQRLDRREALGVVVCISPWNFPLAIFLGQVCAALSVGNQVIAKPAPQTPLVAAKAIDLLYRAGIPQQALKMVIGGAEVGAALTAAPETSGICFTGSTASAKKIAASLAETDRCRVPLIAETGGLNAMIIDSTALLERAVTDVVASAFQSAGQRCSACRIVCVQEDIADEFIEMLQGAMLALKIGDPVDPSIDIGPVIDQAAADKIAAYIAAYPKQSVIAPLALPKDLKSDQFIVPVAIEMTDLAQIKEEIFGPVLHIVRYKAENFENLVSDINQLGYGLTLGLHTRIDQRQQYVSEHAHIGNIYINRNQIGAIVGVQPFGGEGMSGTGPKAGGPYYLVQLTKARQDSEQKTDHRSSMTTIISDQDQQQARILLEKCQQQAASVPSTAKVKQVLGDLLKEDTQAQTEIFAEFQRDVAKKQALPGPTGEENSLRLTPRGVVLLRLTGNLPIDRQQLAKLYASGNDILIERTETDYCAFLADIGTDFEKKYQMVSPEIFAALVAMDIQGVGLPWADATDLSDKILTREGAILPIFAPEDPLCRYMVERTVSIDMTAAGGNVDLMISG